jgi:hypothetical protein
MKERIVSYTRETLPEPAPGEMERLASMRDEDIDFSDIPPITEEQAKHAVRGWENHPGRAKNRKNDAA